MGYIIQKKFRLPQRKTLMNITEVSRIISSHGCEGCSMRLLRPKSRDEVTTKYGMLFSNYFVKYFFLLLSISLDWLRTSNAHLEKEYDHSEKPKEDKGPE